MTATATSFEVHPIASLFPMMTDEEFAGLKKDIAAHGLREPITIYDGKVLDGRNRLRACEELDFEPTTKNFHGEPIEFVVSQNLHRRHLTPSQRSMIAARMREMYDQQAKDRMSAGGKEGGKGRPKQGVENLPPPNDSGKARDVAGKAMGVSGRSVDFAGKVLREAIPEVIQAVDEGRMAVSTAAILASEPKEVQLAEATKPTRNRDYKSVSNGQPEKSPEQKTEPPKADAEIKEKGIGIVRAHEAINCLTRIPKNDALRKRGFQLVTDWIRHNR